MKRTAAYPAPKPIPAESPPFDAANAYQRIGLARDKEVWEITRPCAYRDPRFFCRVGAPWASCRHNPSAPTSRPDVTCQVVTVPGWI